MRLWQKLSSLDRWTLIVTLVLGAIYVGSAWSPSSYGIVSSVIAGPGDGPLLGDSRAIRADEWGVLTPLTQAAVRNGFTRYNGSSYWQEDMRMLYPVPIADWGILFRPLMLPYLLVSAAYAFSFYYFALTALFVWGYALLFRRLGIRPAHALLLSLALLLTGFTQYWWTMFAPTLAWFPWLLVAFTSALKPPVKAAALAYVGACWVLGLFYPPLLWPMALAALVLAVGFFRDRLKPGPQLLWSALGLVAAVAISWLYLRDYVSANLHTVYPGNRTIGGGIDIRLWLSQFFPLLNVRKSESVLAALNICETGMIGTFYALPALCFLNYKKLRTAEGRRVAFAGLWPAAAAFAAFSAWLLLPLPPWAGVPLLFHRIPPERLGFAAGFLLLLAIYLVAERVGLMLSWRRFAAYVALFGAAFAAAALQPGMTPFTAFLLWLPALAVGVLVALREKAEKCGQTALLSIAVVAGALGFGTFNPVQSARPIFNLPSDSKLLQQLAGRAEVVPQHTLVEPVFYGAVLNGLGFRSFTHVLAVPQMDYWARAFPDMPASERNRIFNRYAHIQAPANVVVPDTTNPDLVVIPLEQAREIVSRVPPPAAH